MDLDRLRTIVGATQVLTDPDRTAGYLRDWTGRYVAGEGVVVRPADTDQVAAVLAECSRSGTAVVPQGGNTGLVGGGVPHRGEVVLTVERLTSAPEIDPVTGHLTAGAGVTIGEVQAAAVAGGLRYGVDLASRDSATVGGTIATNAGGIRVIRYGDTRSQLVGFEAVLADGSRISRMNGMTRDNSGYQLQSLLAGSEGTLAVITAARFRLHRPAPKTAVAVAGFTDIAAAVVAAGRLGPHPAVSAVEFMLPTGVALVGAHTRVAPPFPVEYPAYLLVEAMGSDPAVDLGTALDALDGLADAVLADDVRGCADLWALRERHTESIASVGTAVKMDVTLPMDRLAGFLTDVGDLVHGVAPAATTWLFGHVADGNVHVNVTGATENAAVITDVVLRAVAERGGSISTEHGIGVSKRAWLPLTRSPVEIDLYRRLKTAFDPAGILNPNVLFPLNRTEQDRDSG